MDAPSHPASKSCGVAPYWLNLTQNHKRKEILGNLVPNFLFEAEVNTEAEVSNDVH